MATEEKFVEEIVDQEDNFSLWYNQVVRKAELVEYLIKSRAYRTIFALAYPKFMN